MWMIVGGVISLLSLVGGAYAIGRQHQKMADAKRRVRQRLFS